MRILGSSLTLVALMVVACKAAPADETDGSDVTSNSDGESDGDTETGEIIDIDMGGGGDGDGDDDECSGLEILCPDGTCQYGAGAFPEYACCDHGGTCPEQCVPQDASGTEPDCLDPRYAWTGDSCAAICGCEGSDCDAIYDSAIACFLAYPPPCGPDYSSCPFEPPLGPTMITGVTAEGPNTYAYGVFGTVTGKGIDEHPHLRFAADPVSLAEHVPNLFDPPVTPDVFEVEVHGANPYMPGVHPILANHPKPLDPNEYVSGTITITLVDRMTVDHAGHAMHGRIDIVDGGWDLHGEFAIAGCNFLDVQYP